MRGRVGAAAGVYLGVSLVLAMLPLFGVLHVEASAVVAGVGFFVAGLASIRAFQEDQRLGHVLRRHLRLLAIPWGVLTATLIWRPNCDYAAGFGFYVLFSVPSAGLGVALAYALTGWRLRRPRAVFVGLGLAVGLLPVAYDLGLHPQLYTYNHVWGGVLGPIYDEELAIRPGLFAFRGLTLLWVAGLLGFGGWRRGISLGRIRIAGVALAGVLLVLGYVFAVPLGINTSYARLGRALDARAEAPGFVVHYDADAMPEAEVAALQAELAYRYAWLRERLGVAPSHPIHVYVYPDAETRGALIGSRRTSVTPVWLARPQLHMLQEALTPDALGHELVHVFSRAFGMPLMKASPAVGLVEGLAVALEPPDGFPSPAQQVAATLRLRTDDLGGLDAGPARAVAGAMDPLGFWTGRGAVSYLTTGAFAGWLLDRYGPEAMRRVYATADFEGVYGRDVMNLARDWEADLAALPPSPEAEALALWRFSQPSLFERRCPHHIPPEVRWTRLAREAEEAGEAHEALQAYERALHADATYLPALIGWSAQTILTTGRATRPIQRLRTYTRPDALPDPAHLVALGDAYRMAGDSARAAVAYRNAVEALPPWSDAGRALVLLRSRLSRTGLETLLTVGPAASRADRLERLAVEEPAAGVFAAWLWREAGDPARANAAYARWPGPAGLGLDEADLALAEREALAWKADFALRARRYAEALAAATRAHDRMTEAGEEGAARRLGDLIDQARWHLRRR